MLSHHECQGESWHDCPLAPLGTRPSRISQRRQLLSEQHGDPEAVGGPDGGSDRRQRYERVIRPGVAPADEIQEEEEVEREHVAARARAQDQARQRCRHATRLHLEMLHGHVETHGNSASGARVPGLGPGGIAQRSMLGWTLGRPSAFEDVGWPSPGPVGHRVRGGLLK